MKMAVVDKLKEQYVKMDWSNLDWVNDVDISNATVDAVPINVIEGIKADIENISETESITDGITIYGVQYRTGASVKNEILELIDRHIKEYTEC